MTGAREKHVGKVSISDRNLINLIFADGVDSLAEEEQELEVLFESLVKTCLRHKMEISADKTKLVTNSGDGIARKI